MAKEKDNQELQKEIWEKYLKCKDYAEKKGLMKKTERSWNFFVGNQWKGIKSFGEELPMFNFVKTIVNYKVSSVAQNVMTAVYSDMTANSQLNEVYSSLNKYWEQCWEKSKMDNKAWEMMKAAAIQGDSYVYWSDGNTLEPPQVLPNTSIFFEDENINNIQEQGYIIVLERWSLKAAKKHAEENGISKEDIQRIAVDDETDRMLFNKTEVESKVTVLLYMEKDEEGVVRTCRVTDSVMIEPFESKVNKNGYGEIKSKLTIYPILQFVWERVPNSARGVGEVEQLIPNQLELNKTLARRSMAIKMAAYPRLAYDATAIENPEDLDKVGVAIAMQGGSAQSINQMISYLSPANTSSDANELTNELLQTTKDLAGANDYALGNINPEQASGTAIVAVRDQSQVPLSEQIASFRQWVEDVALLWLELWLVFNKDGIEFIYEDEYGMQQPIKLSQDQLRALTPTVRIDVSNDNQWTKLAEQQSLDSMLQQQMITLDEYAELVPENSAVPKQRLIEMCRKRQIQAQMMQQQAMMQQAQSAYDSQAVIQQMVAQGVPEEDAVRMMQQYSQQSQPI